MRVPDVNESSSNFTARAVRRRGVRARSSSACRRCATSARALVAQIVAEREKNGPFSDFHDFCCRVDPFVLNKRSIESLIKAGAFDSLGHPRKGLCLVFEEIIDHVLARRREEELGISTLFSLLAETPADEARRPSTRRAATIPDVEFDKSERLAFEKEMLGLYVSDHPLLGLEAALRLRTERDGPRAARPGDLAGCARRPERLTSVVVGGVVTALSRRYTRRGELMATFVLEDLESAIEVFVFPKTMQEYGMRLEDDAIVCVRGRLDMREDVPKLVAMEITRPELPRPMRHSSVRAALVDHRVDRRPPQGARRRASRSGPGPHPPRVEGPAPAGAVQRRPGGGLVGALKELLGANAVSA